MAKIYGQLERAALEVLSSDPSLGVTGRIWWNSTDNKIKSDDGTNIRAILRNDGYAILGNSGTAANNIRFHRGANGVLQFVSGADVTAEGTLSTALNQISGRVENYATVNLPSNGNPGRIVYDTTSQTLKYDDNTTWQELAAQTLFDSSQDIQNLSISATVAANALTIAAKNKSGSDPSAGSPVKVGFRNATSGTGTYNVRSITSALSAVVSSGSTLGHSAGNNHYIYVYLIDNSGTIELAFSSALFDDGSIVSTTAEGGAGGADSNAVMYSTTARSNVPCRLVARLKSSQATPGTWATNPSEISLLPFEKQYPGARYTTNANQAISNSTSTIIDYEDKSWDHRNEVVTGASWAYTASEPGKYKVNARVTITDGTGFAAGEQFFIGVHKNNSATASARNIFSFSGSSPGEWSTGISTEIDLVAGDTIDIRVFQSSGNTVNLLASGPDNYVDISKSALSRGI